MNRTDTTYKKIKYIRKDLNTNKKNSKIPHYKIKSLLEKKRKKQNIITQIQTTIDNLEEFKSTEKTREKLIYYQELIVCYKREINNICAVLKSKCNHVLINDSIDICPEKSQTIIYCEKCETTF